MPLLQRRRPTQRPRSLTAAAERVKADDSARLRRLVQAWQHRAMGFYEVLGEINFAGQFYARTLSKIRYFAAELDENGDPQETEDPELRKLWDRVQDPGGGRTNLMTAYGQLKFLCGECYLVCTGDDDAPEGEVWEILSVAELRMTDKGRYQRITAPGLGFTELIAAPDDAFEPLNGEVMVYRLFTPDPRYKMLADAPMRGVLTLCEELIRLDLAVRARATSRAAGPGVLLVSDAITQPNPGDGGQGDRDLTQDPVFGPMIESLMAPLSDPGSAAAVVPHILTVPETIDIDKVMKLIKFGDPTEQYQEQQTRDATIKRIATGLDFPIEYMLGMTDANHWSGWLVDEQSWKAHLMPVVQRLCDDFASAYLRPASKDAGIANWQRVTIGYDAAEVINHPDKAKDAFQAYGLRAVSKAYLREAIGATDDDAMPQDELDEAIGVAVRDASMAKFGIPSVRAGGIEPEPGEIENPTGESTAPTGPVSGADVEKGPPAAPPEPRTASLTPLPFETARILGIAEAQLERAREIAGNRIRNRAKGCGECEERIADQPLSMVAATLGPQMAADLLKERDGITAARIGKRPMAAITDRELVDGTSEAFVRTATRIGLPVEWATELGDLVEAHAARTLYEPEPPPLPSTFASLTARALAQPAVEAA